ADLSREGSRVADPSRLRRDQKIERIIGAVLQVGGLPSIVVAVAGALLYLGREGRHVVNFRVFRGEPFDLRSAPAIAAAALGGHREAIIQLGVLVLIATPIARVVLSLVAFAVQR